jgi:hypothetical protein
MPEYDDDDAETPLSHQLRPMPIPSRPETHRQNMVISEVGAGSKYSQPHRQMPRPKRPRPPQIIRHDS